MARLLFVETFYGGSHRQFADALVRESDHDITLLTLPPRFWRWRRRLAAFELERRGRRDGITWHSFDRIVVTDYVDIGDLKALVAQANPGKGLPPIYWYCHETQSTYPMPKGRTIEADVVGTDMRNALHADSMAFNSNFHRDAFLQVFDDHAKLLRRWEPEWDVPSIANKTRVLYPGIYPVSENEPEGAASGDSGSCVNGPLIVWNHRWEYDKNFGAFFRGIARLAQRGIAFRLAILGENPQAHPQEFIRARSELADRLVAFGYAKNRTIYHEWLAKGDIVVSTAIQENFGIAVLEAMSAGCIPLLPGRLSYPELLPQELHAACVYRSDAELESKLEALLNRIEYNDEANLKSAVRNTALAFSWKNRISEFDRWLGE